jgi:hypothetical protein
LTQLDQRITIPRTGGAPMEISASIQPSADPLWVDPKCKNNRVSFKRRSPSAPTRLIAAISCHEEQDNLIFPFNLPGELELLAGSFFEEEGKGQNTKLLTATTLGQNSLKSKAAEKAFVIGNLKWGKGDQSVSYVVILGDINPPPKPKPWLQIAAFGTSVGYKRAGASIDSTSGLGAEVTLRLPIWKRLSAYANAWVMFLSKTKSEATDGYFEAAGGGAMELNLGKLEVEPRLGIRVLNASTPGFGLFISVQAISPGVSFSYPLFGGNETRISYDMGMIQGGATGSLSAVELRQYFTSKGHPLFCGLRHVSNNVSHADTTAGFSATSLSFGYSF